MGKIFIEVITTLMYVGLFSLGNYCFGFELGVIFMCSVIIAKIFMLEK